MIELVEPCPPVQPAELEAAALRLAELGHPIPPSYREFLTQHDGGVPVKDRFSFEHEDRTMNEVVEEFLGVAPPASPHGMNLVRTVRIRERFPKGVLPIADDPFGNHICLDGRDGRDGPVYFWDHEYEGDEPDDANLYEIAPDLPTFLNMLHERAPRAAPARRRGRLQRLLGRR
jgi:cell wall assembly regulator SMI1